MSKVNLLIKLNSLLVSIEKETKSEFPDDKEAQVKLYDRLTKQVSVAVKDFMATKELPDTTDWRKSQISLFEIYKKLTNIK